jgi:5-methylcytosine-specific restriction enzyme subunit McrC
MLLYAWNETPNSPYWQRVEYEESPTLDALLASILVKFLQQRLRIGLGCSYMPEKRMLRGLRGRIHFTNSLKRRSFERGQAYCEFEHYSINAPKNQIIRSTLFHLAQTGQFGTDKALADKLRHEIRWLVRTLDGIDLVELTPDFIHRQQALRHDHDYRIMLAVCDLLLQRRLPTEYDGQMYMSQLERDRFVLHKVYEDFVANFYKFHLRNWRVRPQKVLTWHEKRKNAHLPFMIPDLVMVNPGIHTIILDTKFTASSLKENQWGRALFSSSHLYQIYAYLKTQEHLSGQHLQATGILLYPTVIEELSEVIELPNHSIRIECVDLSAPWQKIESRLMELVGNNLQ